MNFVKRNKSLLSQIGLMFAAFSWGTTFIVVKNTLININPIILVGYRFLLASLIMFPFLIYSKKNMLKNISKGFLLGIFLWLLYAPQTLGLKYTSASNSVLITGLFIVFVPFIGYFLFKKIPSVNQILAVGVAIVGFWLLTGGLHNINIGDVLTIITAASYAVHILIADKLVKNNFDPYILSFQQFLFVGLFSLLAGLLFKLPFNIGNSQILGVIIFLTIIPGLLAFVIQLVAQKYVSPIKVALIFAMEPVFGVLAAIIIGKETLLINKIFGGLFIVISMFIAELNILPSIKKKFNT